MARDSSGGVPWFLKTGTRLVIRGYGDLDFGSGGFLCWGEGIKQSGGKLGILSHAQLGDGPAGGSSSVVEVIGDPVRDGWMGAAA